MLIDPSSERILMYLGVMMKREALMIYAPNPEVPTLALQIGSATALVKKTRPA